MPTALAGIELRAFLAAVLASSRDITLNMNEQQLKDMAEGWVRVATAIEAAAAKSLNP